MQLQGVCHDTLPWLISFSLGRIVSPPMKRILQKTTVFVLLAVCLSTLAFMAYAAAASESFQVCVFAFSML
jgi:hypothetical protein